MSSPRSSALAATVLAGGLLVGAVAMIQATAAPGDVPAIPAASGTPSVVSSSDPATPAPSQSASSSATVSASSAASAAPSDSPSATAAAASPTPATVETPQGGLAVPGSDTKDDCRYTDAQLREKLPGAEVKQVDGDTRYYVGGELVASTKDGKGWGPPCTVQ